MDILFNALLNKDSDKSISNQYIFLYNKFNSKKITTFNNDTSTTSLEDLIKKINGNNLLDFFTADIINNTDATLNKFRCQILRVLFSDLLKVDNTFNLETQQIVDTTTYFFSSNSYNNYINNTDNLINPNNSSYDKNLRTFLLIIKNIFVEDKRDFDKHIQKLKNNFKSLIYGNTSNIINTDSSYNEITFYNDFLLNDSINSANSYG